MRIHAVRRIVLVAVTLALFAGDAVLADRGNDKGREKNGKNDAKHEQQRAKKEDKQRQIAAQKAVHSQRQSQQRRRELIAAQRSRSASYNRRLAQQTRVLQQRTDALRASKRLAQHRYQQQYVARLHQQQLALQRTRDYDNDPYFTTAPAYRYSRGGRTYQVNQYAADVLTLAVNEGYEQGVRAGQADQEDRWSRGRYQDSYAFQDATYGYEGSYVELGEYQHYFREGFRRGYDDGRSTRFQYGSNAGGRVSLLGTVLNAILGLQSLR